MRLRRQAILLLLGLLLASSAVATGRPPVTRASSLFGITNTLTVPPTAPAGQPFSITDNLFNGSGVTSTSSQIMISYAPSLTNVSASSSNGAFTCVAGASSTTCNDPSPFLSGQNTTITLTGTAPSGGTEAFTASWQTITGGSPDNGSDSGTVSITGGTPTGGGTGTGTGGAPTGAVVTLPVVNPIPVATQLLEPVSTGLSLLGPLPVFNPIPVATQLLEPVSTGLSLLGPLPVFNPIPVVNLILSAGTIIAPTTSAQTSPRRSSKGAGQVPIAIPAAELAQSGLPATVTITDTNPVTVTVHANQYLDLTHSILINLAPGVIATGVKVTTGSTTTVGGAVVWSGFVLNAGEEASATIDLAQMEGAVVSVGAPAIQGVSIGALDQAGRALVFQVGGGGPITDSLPAGCTSAAGQAASNCNKSGSRPTALWYTTGKPTIYLIIWDSSPGP